MYIKIKELINKNSIDESLILLNELIKINIEDKNDDTNEHIQLLFLLIKRFYIKQEKNKIKESFLFLESKIEKKIFLDDYYQPKEIEETINLYINFLINFLEDNIDIMDNKDFYFYLNKIFDFLSNLYSFDEFSIDEKYYVILESWTQFNSYNIKKDYNLKDYHNNITKLLKLIGFNKYIMIDNFNDFNFDNNFIKTLINFNEKELFSLSKILHNYSNTFIEFKHKDINKILKFNVVFSNFLINYNFDFSKFIFFFLISNINYCKYTTENFDLDFIKKEIHNILNIKLNSVINYDIFYKKIIFINKTNVDNNIIDYLFNDLINLKVK